MVRHEHGFTLVELLVATAMAGFMILLVSRAFVLFNGLYARSSNVVEQNTTLQAALSLLQRNMAPSDIRFFAFSGNGNTTPPDKTLIRMLVPQPSVCGDQRSAICEQDSSLLYVHLYRRSAPSLTVICLLDKDSLLVDTNNPIWGRSTFAGRTFDVVATNGVNAGKIELAPDTLFSLINPPIATLWYVAKKPHLYDSKVGPPLGDDCINNLQPATPGPYDTSGLVVVPVRPLVLTQFTGGASVTLEEERASLGLAPYQLFPVEIHSLGRASGTPPFVGDFRCHLESGVIVCGASPTMSIPDIAQFRINFLYKIPVKPTLAAEWELLGPKMVATPTCLLPGCAPLPLQYPAFIPGLWSMSTHGESFTDLDSTGFSFLKQESLSQLRLRFLSQKTAAEARIDVIFP